MEHQTGELKDIAIKLSVEGLAERFDCQLVPGEIEVLQVIVNELDEFPVYASVTDTQLLFITYLWTEADVNVEQRTNMLESMLDINRIGKQPFVNR